jgi:hypothetical protein
MHIRLYYFVNHRGIIRIFRKVHSEIEWRNESCIERLVVCEVAYGLIQRINVAWFWRLSVVVLEYCLAVSAVGYEHLLGELRGRFDGVPVLLKAVISQFNKLHKKLLNRVCRKQIAPLVLKNAGPLQVKQLYKSDVYFVESPVVRLKSICRDYSCTCHVKISSFLYGCRFC